MTPRQIEDYLQDMLDAISAAQQFTTGMSFEAFEADQKTIFAVTRAIEIVGEATKSIPPELRGQAILRFPGKASLECAIKSSTSILGLTSRCFGTPCSKIYQPFNPSSPKC